jgi:polysaccharide biosynthesis transport protein
MLSNRSPEHHENATAVQLGRWGDSPSTLAPPSGEGPGPGQLLRYLDAILRYKWLILLLTLAGGAVGIVASRFVQPRYLVQSTIWIEVSNRPRGGTDMGPIRSAELLQSYAWIELLKSFSVLESVVLEQKFYLHPRAAAERPLFESFQLAGDLRPGAYRLVVSGDGREIALSSGDNAVIERGRVGDEVGLAAGFRWLPPVEQLTPGRTVEFTLNNPRDVASGLASMVQTRMAQDGNFLQISLQGTNPVLIADILNAITRRYVEVAAQLKRSRLDEVSVVLGEQLSYAEQNLRDAEISLESFRVQTITLPSEQSNPVAAGIEITRNPAFERFFEMRIAREQQRGDRLAIERALAQAGREEISVDALSAIPAVQASAELVQALEQRTARRADLRALEQRYTDDYPPLRRLRDEIAVLERRTIPQLGQDLIRRILSQESELEDRVLSASEELRRIPPRAIEEARLERGVTIADNLYRTLKQRYEEARLAAESSIPDVRLLDAAAVPNQPVQNQQRTIALLGLLGGLGLAVLGALLLDRFDPKLRYPQQVSDEIGLPIITAIPHLKDDEDVSPQVVEAFRELRFKVGHGIAPGEPILLTISSPESGDGKSFVAQNLAMAFASQGLRTLLIDGDIRRGALNRSFGLDRTPGLTNVLRRDATLNEAIRSTPVPSLFLLPSGVRSQDSPDLLTGTPLPDLLNRLGEHFQVILVDTPPLGAGVDPYILAMATGRLALVLRTNRSNRAFTAAKLDILERFPIRLEGVVLNDVPPSTVYRYYSYLPGYAAHDEVEPASLAAAHGS